MTRSRKRKLARTQALTRATWAGVPLASALMAGGGMAHAADAGDTGTLEEVVVTAQKRSEDLQKVPISLQVLTGQDLEQHQVTDFDSFAKLLPSVSYQSLGPGQSQLYFRGIASGGDGLHAGSLPATGVYLDEIPVTTIGNTLDVHIYDIARIEALAGPQGTLYGASSLSGTLRIITNKPDPTAFSASYDLKADKFGRGRPGEQFEGYVNIPLAEHIAVRLVGFYDHEGGYINNLATTNVYLRGIPSAGIPNDPIAVSNYGNGPGSVEPNVSGQNFNPVTTYGGRGALKIDLNDNWTVMPQILVQDQRADGNFSYDPAKGFLNVGDFGNELNQDKWWQSALSVEGKVSNFDILYSGGFFERNVHNVVDYSGYTVAYDAYSQYAGQTFSATRFQNCAQGTPANNCNGAGGPLTDPTQFVDNHDQYEKLSQELRVTTPVDYRIRGTAGLFYQRQSDNIRAAFQTNDLPSYYAIDGSPNVIYLSQQTRVDRDYAVFGDGTFDVTDKFKISAGIRQFWVNNTLYGFFGFQSYCANAVTPAPVVPNYRPCVNTDKKVVEDGETHKVTLTYQIDPDRMVYGTYSTGFRPGGNNRLPDVASYKADTLTNFELGWKTAWFDHRLRANGAIFYERWKDFQYSVTGVSGITSIVNAANAAVKGIEGDVNWLAYEGLTLSASGTYVNARTTQNLCDLNEQEQVVHTCPASELTAPSGTQLPVTPKLKGSVTGRYEFPMHDYKNFFQATAIHQGSSTSQLQQTAPYNLEPNLPKFTTIDLSAGTGISNWHVEAYVENLFDKDGQLGRIAQCGFSYCYANSRIYPIKPMNFGVKFGQKF
jgi:iron complex outermembrane receptor protein